MTAQTLTLTHLPRHPERGWPVDPATGTVYGVAGRWAGIPIGRVGTHGYYVTTCNGRAFLLHRVVWEACEGPIPPDIQINHMNGVKTDNRLCNLELVTRSQNLLHAYRTGLRPLELEPLCKPRGSAHWSYKITPEMKADILASAPTETRVSIARRLGLSQMSVYRVLSGER